MAKYFRGLGDPTRVRILELLEAEGELSVTELVVAVGEAQSKVSNHLACLRWCGFVEGRRAGRQVRYRVADRRVSELLRSPSRYWPTTRSMSPRAQGSRRAADAPFRPIRSCGTRRVRRGLLRCVTRCRGVRRRAIAGRPAWRRPCCRASRCRRGGARCPVAAAPCVHGASEGRALVRIEVLYFDGCPSHEALLLRLRELMDEAAIDVPIGLIHVASVEGAERTRFLGSPTLRIDGRDVDPTADQRGDYGLKCRLYTHADGLRGAVPDELIRAALRARGGHPDRVTANQLSSLEFSVTRFPPPMTRRSRSRSCGCSPKGSQSSCRRSREPRVAPTTPSTLRSRSGRTSSATTTAPSSGSQG